MTISVADQVRFWGKVTKGEGCWNWTGSRNSDGYGQFRCDGKARKAHRVSFVIANGGIRDGLCVCHRCDNPSCVNPEHLFAATHQVNMKDCAKKGRMHLGEKCANSKLTAGDVIEIRRAYHAGETQHSIGRRYGISQVTVFKIVNRRTWPHVP